MPVEAYAIGINLVGNAEKVVGENNKVIKSLERVQASLKATQGAMNDMVASLRGAGRVAASLAAAMAQVATSAREAATASARIKAPPGGGGGGSVGGAPSAPAFTSNAMASVAANVAAQQASARRGPALLPAPPERLRLGYDPNTNARDYMGGANGYGGPSNGFAMGESGPTIGPSRPARPGPSAPYSPFQSNGQGGALTVPQPGVGRAIPLNLGTTNLTPSLPRLPRLPSVPPGVKVIGAYAGYETVKGAYEQGSNADDIIAQMKSQVVPDGRGGARPAFSAAQIVQAQSLATNMIRTTPGLGYTDALKIILQTSGNLADSREGMALAPQIGLDATVLSRISGGKGGDLVGGVEQAVLAGELSGITNKDGSLNVAKMTNFVAALSRTDVRMGGNLDIGKYRTGLRQFGAGAGTASTDFLVNVLPAIMKIMGESRAGTALGSLQQLMLSYSPNTRNKAVMAEQQRMGLRDAKGRATFVDDLQGNPLDYGTDVIASLAAHGIVDDKAQQEEILKLFPRATAQRLITATKNDRGLITKEVNANRAGQVAGDKNLIDLLNNAPGAQFQKFAEGFKALEAVTTDAAMGPTMQIIDRLTRSFYNITDYVKGHPKDVSDFAGQIEALLSMVLKVAKFVGHIYAELPAPLQSAVRGAVVGAAAASIVPGVGTATGGVVGAAIGLGRGLANSTLPSKQDYMVDGKLIHPEAYVTQMGGGYGGGDIHITMPIYLDGKQLAQPIERHITAGVRAAARRGSNWDGTASLPSPGQMVRA